MSGDLYPVSDAFAASARIRRHDYERQYADALRDPDAFWGEAARRLDWMRAPSHAPEVMAEIERTIRQASPFPAPARLGRVVYTDTWLWDKSGQFQLDTLTEGQD